MAKQATRISDVQEKEWTESTGTAVVGLIILIVAAIVLYFMRFYVPPELLYGYKIVGSLAVIIGGVIVIAALYRGTQVNLIKKVPFACPYCDKPINFDAPPTHDFDCEHCSRTVQFIDGDMVSVQTVICRACRTEHRVAENVSHYVCDRCNRPLLLTPTKSDDQAVVKVADFAGKAPSTDYMDVLLSAFDRRHETELAFKLQNILLTNLPDARKMMATASDKTPLVVGINLPPQKAEAVKRSLQELGGTVTLRKHGEPGHTARRS